MGDNKINEVKTDVQDGWQLDKMEIFNKFMNIPQNEGNKNTKKIIAEYVWIGGSGSDLRSKGKIIEVEAKIDTTKILDQLPIWNYDGSSTGQAEGKHSEVLLKPVKIIKDPFRLNDNIIVLCETINSVTKKPLPTNSRSVANEIFNNKKVKDEEIWYGIEQEYFLMKKDEKTPLGWSDDKNIKPKPQGPYYCGIGQGSSFGRMIVECHLRAMLYCGLDCSGINAEVAPGQFEYQIGPCTGIDSGDQLWLSRYLLIRTAEMFNVYIEFHPKPMSGKFNGSGAHCNCSTKSMRKDGGYKLILEAVEKLGKRHAHHIKNYGDDNHLRLSGKYETAHIDAFSYGVGNRGASIRIPTDTEKDGKGYFEDRRPASNCDPYVVTSLIAETVILK